MRGGFTKATSITTAVEKLKELQITSLDSQSRIALVQNYIEPRLLEWVQCAYSEVDKFIYSRSGYYFPTDSSIGEQPLTYLADEDAQQHDGACGKVSFNGGYHYVSAKG